MENGRSFGAIAQTLTRTMRDHLMQDCRSEAACQRLAYSQHDSWERHNRVRHGRASDIIIAGHASPCRLRQRGRLIDILRKGGIGGCFSSRTGQSMRLIPAALGTHHRLGSRISGGCNCSQRVSAIPPKADIARRCPMSALGQKRTLQSVRPMSALPPKADISECDRNVRQVPIADTLPSITSPASARQRAL